MAKRATLTKRLTPENLARLGAERLAALLAEMAEDDPIWKRRLRMELAGERGAEDLSTEIDKRLNSVAASRGRVSWRKRPDLLRDLQSVLGMITGPLADLDPPGAFARLLMWLALFPGLNARVKDPKGEVLGVFLDAAGRLADSARAAQSAGAPAGRLLAEAIAAQPGPWARWLGPEGGEVPATVAADALARLKEQGASSLARRAVIGRLADLSGDVDAWLDVLPEAQRGDPDTAAEIARRLVAAGRPQEARAALDAADPRRAKPRGIAFGGRRATAHPGEAWDAADIAVREALGDAEGAQAARWAAFERELSIEALRDYIGRLDDFEDVVALEKAFDLARRHANPIRGLDFFMRWPDLREAAKLVEARNGEIGRFPQAAEFAQRLEQRYPEAAALLARRAL